MTDLDILKFAEIAVKRSEGQIRFIKKYGMIWLNEYKERNNLQQKEWLEYDCLENCKDHKCLELLNKKNKKEENDI